MSDRVDAQYKALRANFRRVECREWWLWASVFVITLLFTVALASFLLPGADFHQDFTSQHMMSQGMRGLVALAFLFDLYTIYQHLLIHRIRRLCSPLTRLSIFEITKPQDTPGAFAFTHLKLPAL